MKKLFLVASIFFLFNNSLYAESNACQKYYKIDKYKNEYVRLIPEEDNSTLDNVTIKEEPHENSWDIDCKENKILYTNGTILREYVLESIVFYKENKSYIIKYKGMEEGVPVKKEMKIDFLDSDKVNIYDVNDNKTDNVYTTIPTNYKVIK